MSLLENRGLILNSRSHIKGFEGKKKVKINEKKLNKVNLSVMKDDLFTHQCGDRFS